MLIFCASRLLGPPGYVVWLSLAKTIRGVPPLGLLIIPIATVTLGLLKIGNFGLGIEYFWKSLPVTSIKLFGFVNYIIPGELVPTTGDMRRNDVLVG